MKVEPIFTAVDLDMDMETFNNKYKEPLLQLFTLLLEVEGASIC